MTASKLVPQLVSKLPGFQSCYNVVGCQVHVPHGLVYSNRPRMLAIFLPFDKAFWQIGGQKTHENLGLLMSGASTAFNSEAQILYM
jgi:hypothetical protein